MPKRATLTFSSDDASHIKSQELHVFYCKYSGQHAMTTDCDLTKVGCSVPPAPVSHCLGTLCMSSGIPARGHPAVRCGLPSVHPMRSQAPRRRTDGAAVVDTERYQVKLYTTPGGEKLIKRRGGAVEKQYRLNLGRLPVAYRQATSLLPGCRYAVRTLNTLALAYRASML